MYIIAGVILVGYLILWLVSRRVMVEGKGPRPTVRMGAWIYAKVQQAAGTWPLKERIRANLERLHPGNEPEKLTAQYYAEKLGLILAILLAGTLLGIFVTAKTDLEKNLQNGNLLERGDYRDPGKELELAAKIEGYPEQSILLELEGRVPGKETVDQLEREFWEQLKTEALGDNEAWDHVNRNLSLRGELKGYPFAVEWFSDRLSVVDEEGNVKELSYGENEQVMLSVRVTYHSWEWMHELEVTVVSPVEEEELLAHELEKMLSDREEKSRNDAALILPDRWQGKEIHWSEQSDNTGILLWLMTLAVGAGVFFLKDRDLDTKIRDRQRQLRNSYPGIVHKLELYLRAGLTVRSALERIADMYVHDRREGAEEAPACEELLHTCRELYMGIDETQVYERLGCRCGLQEYMRLGALLAQNTVKGSGGLTDRLREEAANVRKEQIQRSRQFGEEASTKLLVPMVMMLGIVMVMIMIPAFGNF